MPCAHTFVAMDTLTHRRKPCHTCFNPVHVCAFQEDLFKLSESETRAPDIAESHSDRFLFEVSDITHMTQTPWHHRIYHKTCDTLGIMT